MLLAFAICLPGTLQAGVEHLLPKVRVLEESGKAPFVLHRAVSITYSNGAEQCSLLEDFFIENGCTLSREGAAVKVCLVKSIKDAYDYELYGYENEAYALRVSANKIHIEAVTNTGVIRATQTLMQLAEGCQIGHEVIDAVKIVDWPAFKLRGYMHDTGRSYIPTDELIKQIELLSRFKVNTFHWHLTENQAWRFEVKAYPELTSVASMTRHEGEYYTHEECKAVMEAAKKHGVIVIPEIDMPGHSDAFERAMGFGMQTAEGKKVLKAALDEVAEVFADAPYIHIGGDEVSTTSDYLNEMIAHVESKGKKAGIWNPINGIGQNALNASLAQMWGTRGLVAPGKANVDCRYNYTNHFDVFADLVGIYKSTIYYKERGDATVAGSISACWNDRKLESVADIMAQNNVYANIIASAERGWLGGGKRYIDNCNNGGTNGGGGVMLPGSGDEYEEFADWERRFLFHKAHSLRAESIPYVKQANVCWRITETFPNDGDASKVFPPEEQMNDNVIQPKSYQYHGQTYRTGIATGAGIYLRHTWGNNIIGAYYDAPLYNQTAYAWTYVYSPMEQEAGAIIEFYNYSRSEQDPAPAIGQWDLYGSNIWLNGCPIPAPSYENTGVNISSREVTLKNENFTARKPIAVQLRKGWNKVFLKLPYIDAPYRLDKWMFTFVLTDKEGRQALDGLIYSPDQQMSETSIDENLDIFSEKYGEKPYRLKMYRDQSYTAGLRGEGKGANGSTQVSDLSAASELWYAVGTADAFKLYNKAAGRKLALTVSEYAEGASAVMAPAESATIWKLIDKHGGYAIVPVSAINLALNAFGGKGSNLKLYTAVDQGGWWIFDKVSENTLTVKVETRGKTWEPNSRIADINLSVNGLRSGAGVTGNTKRQTYYLPSNTTTLSLYSTAYRGYTVVGFENQHGGIVSSIANLNPTDGNSIKAIYESNDWRTLYYTPDSNGYPYRIPAIATAPNGDIFAISDNRPCGMDIGYGEVDIKCRISTDDGRSWSDEFFVANGEGGNANVMTTGFGDAAIVADRDENRLLVMMVCGRTVCWNGRWTPEKSLADEAVNRVARLYATYNEASKKWEWSQPEEVTNSIYSLFLDANGQPTVSSLFIGSGKICQSRVVKKDRYYRLYCSMWTRDGGNRVIYSDDFGSSWNVLGEVTDRPAPYGDEPKIEELPDGTVVLSSRKGGGRYFNLFSFEDGTYTTGTWGTAVSSNDVQDGLSFGRNSTNGEILLVNAVRKSDGSKCDLMLQSVPTGDGRSGVSIFYKEMVYNADGGNVYTPTSFAQDWTLGLQVSDRGSAYSTMTMQADGRVAFLYEEEPGGYCIVYAPLSIEAITGGRYVVDDKK